MSCMYNNNLISILLRKYKERDTDSIFPLVLAALPPSSLPDPSPLKHPLRIMRWIALNMAAVSI